MRGQKFLLILKEKGALWYGAQGEGGWKQGCRDISADIRVLFQFLYLARARARARVDRRPKRLGALGSPLRVLKEGRPFSRAWAGGVLLFKPAERGFMFTFRVAL